jgi:hypothetical protein
LQWYAWWQILYPMVALPEVDYLNSQWMNEPNSFIAMLKQLMLTAPTQSDTRNQCPPILWSFNGHSFSPVSYIFLYLDTASPVRQTNLTSELWVGILLKPLFWQGWGNSFHLRWTTLSTSWLSLSSHTVITDNVTECG